MKQLFSALSIFALFSIVLGCASMTGESAGQNIDDATITSAINMKIIEDPQLSYLKINVDTFKGNVTLSGAVPNKEAENRLIALAKSVKGVNSVKSNMIIQPPSGASSETGSASPESGTGSASPGSQPAPGPAPSGSAPPPPAGSQGMPAPGTTP